MTSSTEDNTVTSYILTISILVISIVIYFVFSKSGPEFDSGQLHGSGGLFTLILTLFRLACAYLVIHTTVFWMVKNPVPGIMTP